MLIGESNSSMFLHQDDIATATWQAQVVGNFRNRGHLSPSACHCLSVCVFAAFCRCSLPFLVCFTAFRRLPLSLSVCIAFSPPSTASPDVFHCPFLVCLSPPLCRLPPPFSFVSFTAFMPPSAAFPCVCFTAFMPPPTAFPCVCFTAISLTCQAASAGSSVRRPPPTTSTPRITCPRSTRSTQPTSSSRDSPKRTATTLSRSPGRSCSTRATGSIRPSTWTSRRSGWLAGGSTGRALPFLGRPLLVTGRSLVFSPPCRYNHEEVFTYFTEHCRKMELNQLRIVPNAPALDRATCARLGVCKKLWAHKWRDPLPVAPHQGL